MNEHQKVSRFNRGKMSIIYTICQVQVNLLSCLVCLSDKNGRFGVVIGQITCQSNSLWGVNWVLYLNTPFLNRKIDLVTWLNEPYDQVILMNILKRLITIFESVWNTALYK